MKPKLSVIIGVGMLALVIGTVALFQLAQNFDQRARYESPVRMEGEDLKQTLVTIGISIVLADLMIATGMHCFPKTLLGAYRDFVVHPVHGPALSHSVCHSSTRFLCHSSEKRRKNKAL